GGRREKAPREGTRVPGETEAAGGRMAEETRQKNEAARLAEEEARKALAFAQAKAEGDKTIRHLLYDANVKLAARAWDGARLVEARQLLAQQDEALRGWEWDSLHSLATRPSLVELRHARAVNAVAFGPDGRRLATAGDDGALRVFDAATGKELFATPPSKARALAVVFSKNHLLAAAWADGKVRL